ncbi:hypothetical protein TrRE_jg4380, partial [Triparma retinervis]
MVANLQASDGPGEAVTEEGKKEIEMARARQTPHRMDLRKMSRKMSLTPMAGNVAEAEAAAAAAAAGNITTLYASSDIRTKALHNLTEEDGHCIGKSIAEDFYQSGKRVDVCLKAAREKFKAIDDFVAGWKADGSKGKEVLWFVPLMTTILENKPFNFRRDTKFGDAVHIASCNCFGVKKNKEARRARRLQRKRLTEVNSMKSANNLDHETSAVMGMTLGASFTRSLFTCVNAEAAVDEWFLQEIFLEEMAAFNPWFLPMLTEIGHVLLMRAPWGLWLRIGIIFVLNYLNIALDFYLIHKNLISEDIASSGGSEGEGCDGDGDGGELMSPKLLGYAMLACYGLQLIAKVCLSNEQNRFVVKNEVYQIRDIILTFLFFNPVEETYKIVKNSHKNGNEVFEPHMLLLAEKQLDLTFGDLPVIFCADLILYMFLLHVFIGSLMTWHPTGGLVSTAVTRLCEYVTTYAAPQMLFRGPCSIGGRLWSTWVAFSWVQNFAMVAWAFASVGEDEEEKLFGFETWGASMFAAGNLLLLLSSLALSRLLKPAYRRTFYELETTKSYIHRVFWRAKEGEHADFRNAMRCEAITVASHLRPAKEEVRDWLENWGKWEMEMPHWFEMNKDLLLVSIDIEFLGKEWVKKHFWESSDSFLKFTAATCPLPGVRPDASSIARWLSSVELSLGDKSRKEGEHLPSWWNERG